MNRKPRSDEPWDDFLKAAMPDDLPAEVAAGMRARIAEFRADIIRAEERPVRRIRIPLKGAWAALGILLLVVGSLLQGFRSRTPLADKISLLKADISNREPARSAAPAPADREIPPEDRPAIIPDEKETRS